MKHSTRTIAWLIGGMLLLGASIAQAQDWPQWRGPHRDNKVVGFTEPKTWPKELTKKWRVKVGLGESSPLMVGDKFYVFGRIGSDEVTMCLDAMTGKEIWKDQFASTAITGASAKLHQGPRSTPAIAEGKICTLGVRGAVSCLDATTGKLLWRKETKPVPQFYTSSSPLIADGKCIVYVNTLTAFDLSSGDAKWRWKGGGAPYGSPNLMTVDGAKQIVSPYMVSPQAGGIAGISLTEGKLLWQVKIEGPYQSHYSTPIIDGQTVYYSAAGGKKGGGNTLALKIEKKNDGYAAAELWKKPFAAHFYHAPILKDNMIVGVSSGKTFFGVDAKTGKELWKDTVERGQCGSILDAGSVFLSVTSDKKLVVFKADRNKYTEVATYTVADNGEPWSVPIVAGNRIYVKDKGGSLTLWTIE
jgi:outer membrane protein assembly factor BamB